MSDLPPTITPTDREHALMEMIAADAYEAVKRQPELLEMPVQVLIDLLYAQREVARAED